MRLLDRRHKPQTALTGLWAVLLAFLATGPAAGQDDKMSQRRLGLRFSHVAFPSQSKNLDDALALLANTDTGKRLLADIGASAEGRADLRELSSLGIDLLVGSLPDSADTYRTRRKGENVPGFSIVIDRRIALAHPAALAPIIGHELAHVKDRRDAEDRAEIQGPTERRGYLLQTHIALELEESGMMPAPDWARKEEARLILDQLQISNIWRGRPISHHLFGAKRRHQMEKLERMIQGKSGLAAVLAFVGVVDKLSAGIPNWDAPWEEPSQYILDFYARLEREDAGFAARRNASGAPDAQSEYSIPVAAPSRPPTVPFVRPRSLAVAVPVDNEMMRKLEQEEGDVQAQYQSYLQDIARWSCAHAGGLDREDIGYINHSIDWILEHGRFHGLARPSRAAEGLSGCAKELLEGLIVKRQWPPPEDQLDPQWANDEAARLVEKNKPAPPPPAEPPLEIKTKVGWEYKPAPSDYLGPCGNLGSGCTR